eukprot:4220414-Pyramimonas_sp.AAC.1
MWGFEWSSHGATILVRGVPTWPEAAMRTLPLRPSVETPWGHDLCEVCAYMARGRNANPATRAFGQSPYRATSAVLGLPSRSTRRATARTERRRRMEEVEEAEERRRGEERGAPSLQQEGPTPHAGWTHDTKK